MVRQTKQTPDEKKGSHKKKTTPHDDRPSKKKPESGVWPCKINGCNKLFAREADLKRHQRTTKLHSVPSFACPQCDATFTRTDALRRHQKSRHNGIIIEPSESERTRGMMDEGPQASGLRTRTRSRSPSSKENLSGHPMTHALPSGGPQSYYRQHTLPGVLIPPPPPGVLVDGQYPPGFTSATRLQQPPWHHPPWADGSQTSHPPHMIPIGYPPPHPAYYGSSYYRPGIIPPPPDLVSHPSHPQQSQPQQPPNGAGSPHTAESSSSRTPSPVMAALSMPQNQGEGDASGAAPVIDPSLDMGTTASGSSTDDSANPIPLEDAVEAVLRSVSAERENSVGSPHAAGGGPDVSTVSEGCEAKTEDLSSAGEVSHSNPAYSTPGSALERPPEMEQMLTEDGEPMLNPAELLTQESLASPPPS